MSSELRYTRTVWYTCIARTFPKLVETDQGDFWHDLTKKHCEDPVLGPHNVKCPHNVAVWTHWGPHKSALHTHTCFSIPSIVLTVIIWWSYCYGVYFMYLPVWICRRVGRGDKQFGGAFSLSTAPLRVFPFFARSPLCPVREFRNWFSESCWFVGSIFGAFGCQITGPPFKIRISPLSVATLFLGFRECHAVWGTTWNIFITMRCGCYKREYGTAIPPSSSYRQGQIQVLLLGSRCHGQPIPQIPLYTPLRHSRTDATLRYRNCRSLRRGKPYNLWSRTLSCIRRYWISI